MQKIEKYDVMHNVDIFPFPIPVMVIVSMVESESLELELKSAKIFARHMLLGE